MKVKVSGINFTKLNISPLLKWVSIIVASLWFSASISFAQSSESPGPDLSNAPKIVVLGDSLSAGYQLPAGAGFPEKLQEALNLEGVEAKIIGAGVSGDTTSGGLARLNWSVPDDTAGVLLELGANDALRGLPPEKTKSNLEAMITGLLERDIQVLVIGMLAPPNMGQDYAMKFNPIFAELAGKYELLLYPFFLDGVMAQPGMTLEDRMHPNEKGVDEMVKRSLPTIIRFIENMRPSP